MKVKIRRFVLVLVGLVATGVLGFVAWVQLTWDKAYDEVPYPDLHASDDPEVIARGEYLVRGPAHCSNCHVGSLEDVLRSDAGEVLPLSGGWLVPLGPLGSMSTRNLTPDPETGIGRYSDGEIFRMMRHNVRPNGRASIAPMMPFQTMADEDLVAVVSYLRSLEPVHNEVPDPQWSFMGRMILAIRLPPFAPVIDQTWPETAPPMAPTPERGEYVARSLANCSACHSPMDPMTASLAGPEFSGALKPEPSFDPDVMVRAPNLTPHEGGVLLRFQDEDAWVARFRAGRVIHGSFMHWGPFSRMTDADLRALYRFFLTLDPVDNDLGPVVIATSGG